MTKSNCKDPPSYYTNIAHCHTKSLLLTQVRLSLSLLTHCASVSQPPPVPPTNMFCDHHDHPNVDLHFATTTNPNKSIFRDLRLALSLSPFFINLYF